MPWDPETPAPPPDPLGADHVQWTLAKDGHQAQLAVRDHSEGLELRVLVDGLLAFSDVIRRHDGRDLRAVSEHHRTEFLERGWTATSE